MISIAENHRRVEPNDFPKAVWPVPRNELQACHADSFTRYPALPVSVLYYMTGSPPKPVTIYNTVHKMVFRAVEKEIGKFFFVPQTDK